MAAWHRRAMVSVLALATPARAQNAARGATWVRLERSDLGFAAEFPGAPSERPPVPHDDPDGRWVNYSFVARASAGAGYQVTVKDYSAYRTEGVAADALLLATCEGLVAARPEMHLDATNVIAGPIPRRACAFHSDDGGRTAAEVYWSAPMLYVTLAACDPAACAGERANFVRFLAGFRVTPRAPRRAAPAH